MIRLFVGIELPDTVRERLGWICCDVPGARWVEPGQMHLTLRFIGEVDEIVFDDVDARLAEVRAARFPLAVRGVGHFPPRGVPRLLWAGLERSEPLVALQRRVEAAVVRAGVEPEARRFAPHVTLARLDGTPQRAVGSFLATHGLLRCDPFEVDAIHLFSSVLGRKRALHRRESSYPLAVADAAEAPR